MSDDSLTVQCPDCECELVIDRQTGKVLIHRSKPEELPDFDRLLQGLDEQKARADRMFEREKAAHDDRDRILEERFKEALKRAEETPDDEKPIRPFDLD